MKILYEDAVMLAAVKPQGMPAQADKTGDLDLLSALEEYTGQPLGLLHRLDRPVGGVMLFAKEKRAEAFLAKEIQEHRLKKAYLTVLCGRLPAAEGGLEDYLLKNARTFPKWFPRRERVQSVPLCGIGGLRRKKRSRAC